MQVRYRPVVKCLVWLRTFIKPVPFQSDFCKSSNFMELQYTTAGVGLRNGYLANRASSLTMCHCLVALQDTSGSRAKDPPAAPSPVQISTSAQAAAHGELLPPVHMCNALPAAPHYKKNTAPFNMSCSFSSPVNPHYTAPPSALHPLMTTAVPQPALPGSGHAFQVSFCPCFVLTHR